MSTGVRVPLAVAAPVAWDIREDLAPSCERIVIAGSIRRGRPDIGDIELVAIPKVREEHAPTYGMGFFVDAEHMTTVNLLAEAVSDLRYRGVLDPVAGRTVGGERYIKAVHAETGLQVDIFMVRPPATWGCLLLIRTGPESYSRQFVTDARRRGHHFADGMLHKGGLGCGSYLCEVVDTPTEESVYEALGLPFVDPERRA